MNQFFTRLFEVSHQSNDLYLFLITELFIY